MDDSSTFHIATVMGISWLIFLWQCVSLFGFRWIWTRVREQRNCQKTNVIWICRFVCSIVLVSVLKKKQTENLYVPANYEHNSFKGYLPIKIWYALRLPISFLIPSKKCVCVREKGTNLSVLFKEILADFDQKGQNYQFLIFAQKRWGYFIYPIRSCFKLDWRRYNVVTISLFKGNIFFFFLIPLRNIENLNFF